MEGEVCIDIGVGSKENIEIIKSLIGVNWYTTLKL